jgi:hypothetical protein
MAFNHSRLPALQRFQLIHQDVIEQENLRIKISKRSRMLFRDLIDNDFRELNQVIELVPVFVDIAVDQLINGRMWNDITADEREATMFLSKVQSLKPSLVDQDFFQALYQKLVSFEDYEPSEVKNYLKKLIEDKTSIDLTIKEYYKTQTQQFIQNSTLHILQKKELEKLAHNLL